MTRTAKVFPVRARPGNPDLLTQKALRLLEQPAVAEAAPAYGNSEGAAA